MKLLCIAEKPSVTREIEAVYKKYGHPQHQIDFAAFHGHLMKLADADYYDPKYKHWAAEDLPILPKFQYLEEDKASCKQLMQKIKNGGYDGLINACDAGREGELIFYSFYEAEKLTLPVLRFWASDVTEETLKKALHSLKDAKDFQGLRDASKLRAEADWLVGINMTRAATVKSKTKVPIGRVQSPTLKLVVDRELEIKNFVPQDFFEVKARFAVASGETYDGTFLVPPDHKETRIDKKEEAEKIQGSIGKTAVVTEVHEELQKTKAPTLYSLTELQKDASKMFGFRADKTLDLAQNLYQTHKILSYPRTESRFLPTAMKSEIQGHLAAIQDIPELKPYVTALSPTHVDKIMSSKAYVDNAKITDHHAIIPTKQKPNLSKLTDDEKKLYLLVCKRLVAIFMPPYQVMKTTLLSTCANGNVFRTTGKVVKDPGYSVLYASNAKDVILPAVKKGDPLTVKKTGLVAKQTTPPQRYTTATLLAAMQNVGQKLSSQEMRQILKESAGIGTPATRASILSKLEGYGMVVVRRQAFVPTDFGMAVVNSYQQHKVFSPELTAEWENQLRKVEENNLDPNVFRSTLAEFVKKEVAHALTVETNLRFLSRPIVGECPFCGSPMRSLDKYFVCSNYKNGPKPCNGCFNKEFFGHKITDAEMRGILSGKPTKPLSLKAPSGKTWTAGIMYDSNKKSLRMAGSTDFSHADVDVGKITEKNKICTCPYCGGTIYKAKNYYLCSNRSVAEKNCEFIIPVQKCGYTITMTDVRELAEYGQTKEKRSFIWKNGTRGFAFIALENNGIQLVFN